ncbi:MAG: hypothetical protein KJ614_06370 [Gammaproteobacteria bacterium]|nr:hypothetical protein [Rhodoferax sp.]MBU3898541.1 hypothetical protein [Gammaproteobacteria bacterium]MBU3997868.1 hypothetical protein [Gammaproteobacteria bacterium]MBU4079316.1 hypothetical protein [Gammaproteobacteria bacterium]MBU4113222.1 hypothetical protein [Gammaproteobacteria bacterium]MBU4171244.1 hypothetical protein [Gammaproteobacteria bacterium]
MSTKITLRATSPIDTVNLALTQAFSTRNAAPVAVGYERLPLAGQI